MIASKVEVAETTRQYYDKGLSSKQRRALREQVVISYIKSKPSGTRIRAREFAAIMGIKTNTGAHSAVRQMVKRGLISETNVSPRVFTYSVNDAKTIEPAQPQIEVTPPPEIQPEVKPDIQQLAKEFAWNYNSDSLREFVKWLESK